MVMTTYAVTSMATMHVTIMAYAAVSMTTISMATNSTAAFCEGLVLESEKRVRAEVRTEVPSWNRCSLYHWLRETSLWSQQCLCCATVWM
jgi:hypothetical protein